MLNLSYGRRCLLLLLLWPCWLLADCVNEDGKPVLSYQRIEIVSGRGSSPYSNRIELRDVESNKFYSERYRIVIKLKKGSSHDIASVSGCNLRLNVLGDEKLRFALPENTVAGLDRRSYRLIYDSQRYGFNTNVPIYVNGRAQPFLCSEQGAFLNCSFDMRLMLNPVVSEVIDHSYYRGRIYFDVTLTAYRDSLDGTTLSAPSVKQLLKDQLCGQSRWQAALALCNAENVRQLSRSEVVPLIRASKNTGFNRQRSQRSFLNLYFYQPHITGGGIAISLEKNDVIGSNGQQLDLGNLDVNLSKDVYFLVSNTHSFEALRLSSLGKPQGVLYNSRSENRIDYKICGRSLKTDVLLPRTVFDRFGRAKSNYRLQCSVDIEANPEAMGDLIYTDIIRATLVMDP